MTPALRDLLEDQTCWILTLYGILPVEMLKTLDSLHDVTRKVRDEVRRMDDENMRLKARCEANQLQTV
jgi:hypothetical protein